jgi:hypothetical protein
MDAWRLGDVVTAWITENFPGSDTRILELGCGTGTVERSMRYQLFTVEHDEAFLTDYVETIFAPIVENAISSQYNEQGWYDITAIESLKGLQFDLLIIDGPPGGIGRSGILSIPWLLKQSTCILVDDTHREPESNLVTEIEAMLMNVEREEIIEDSEWGLRKSTVLRWSETCETS